MKISNIVKARRAFTLVELLIVIIIIAVLAAVVVPKFVNSGLRSREAALKSDLKLLRNAVDLFKNDTGVYPASLNDLTVTTAPANGLDSTGATKAITASDYKGPYIESISKDAVGGGNLNYSTTSGSVGKVTSSATGNASDGTAYSTW
jgi:general secretion pathway protein G